MSGSAHSRLYSLIFPQESRHLPGQRWINISLRTLHLIGLAGIGAGYLYPALDETWRMYLYLTLASGALLALLSIWSNGIWFMQLRGQVILLKLLLLFFITHWPPAGAALLIVVIILSSWISHAPGNTRYYSFYHGRRLDSLWEP